MKKSINTKKSPAKKSSPKTADSGELRKPAKLKPLKEKEKKNWKQNLDDDDDDFLMVDDDLKFDAFGDDDDDDDDYYDDDNY